MYLQTNLYADIFIKKFQRVSAFIPGHHVAASIFAFARHISACSEFIFGCVVQHVIQYVNRCACIWFINNFLRAQHTTRCPYNIKIDYLSFVP
jgi:hypothetical protein